VLSLKWQNVQCQWICTLFPVVQIKIEIATLNLVAVCRTPYESNEEKSQRQKRLIEGQIASSIFKYFIGMISVKSTLGYKLSKKSGYMNWLLFKVIFSYTAWQNNNNNNWSYKHFFG
jgi:hypothetical protein